MGRLPTPFQLAAADQATLHSLTQTGCRPVRTVRRGQALLALAEGLSQPEVAERIGFCRQTVSQLRRRYEQAGLSAALADAPRSGGPRRFDGAVRAQLTALACSPAPAGRSRWTLRLLADKAVELHLVETISHETVGQVLKKMNYSPIASSTGVWGR